MIKGSHKTPYENHLLLFDIQLLEDYPDSAPKIIFYTMGMEVNPSFNVEDGSVTLPHGLFTPPNQYTILDFLKYIRGELKNLRQSEITNLNIAANSQIFCSLQAYKKQYRGKFKSFLLCFLPIDHYSFCNATILNEL